MNIFVHFIHLLAAVIWIGGTFFIGMVLIPTLRRALNEQERMRMILNLGRKFRPFAWGSLTLLWLTGFIKLFTLTGFHNFVTFFTYPYGHILGLKIILVFIATILAFLHEFVVGKRYAALLQESDANPQVTQRMRRQSILLAVASEVILLLILFLAVLLRFHSAF